MEQKCVNGIEYWVDEGGNKWSVKIFTEKQAIRLSKTLFFANFVLIVYLVSIV